MDVRTRLLRALYRELYGPREGVNEINRDPDFEYVTGVMAPKSFKLDPVEEPADLNETKKILNETGRSVPAIYNTTDSEADGNEEGNPFDIESTGVDTNLDPRSR